MATQPKQFLVHVNFNQNEIQNGVIQNLATHPTSPVERTNIYKYNRS